MFNVGAGELMLIAVAALLILGPKRLPEMMRVVGKFLREFRRQTDDVRTMVEREFYKMDEDIVRPLDANQAPQLPPPEVVDDPADPALHPDHPANYKDDNPPIHVPPEPVQSSASPEPLREPAPVAQPAPEAVSREKAREQQKAAVEPEKKLVN